jgi:hypothetical protein
MLTLLTISGSALTVNIPVAASTLVNAAGLPHQLGTLLPASTLEVTWLGAAGRRCAHS